MNFFQRVENFAMNRFGGKLVARVSVTAAGAIVTWLSSDQAQAAIAIGISKAAPFLDAVGIHIQAGPVNPIALTALVGAAAHVLFEWFKAARAKNPNSPTVDTAHPDNAVKTLPAK